MDSNCLSTFIETISIDLHFYICKNFSFPHCYLGNLVAIKWLYEGGSTSRLLILFYLLVCTCISFTLSWILYFYTRCGKGFSSVTFPLAFLLLLSSCYSHPSLFSDSSSQKYCKFSNRVLVTLTLHKTCGVSS